MIYILDDEPTLVNLLVEAASLVGLSAQGHTRAKPCLRAIEDRSEDAILILDLQMPEMDGIEVMRRLAQLPHPPALILTSGRDSGVLHAAEKLGQAQELEILASLGKPIAIKAFQDVLLRHIQHPRRGPKVAMAAADLPLTATDLQRAIANNELLLHYQPQYAITARRLAGVEALLRWQHPELGLLYPDRIIPLAEQAELMGPLTNWVIATAIEQALRWQGTGLAVSVNIAADNITSLTLPEQLAALLQQHRIDPTLLTLEVTETALMTELVTSLDILTRLRLKGIGLSIDDFGTGYSSLALLHRVPFSELKIDKGFVMHIDSDAEARAIVKTCIILGHELNMRVIAEGVENEQTLVELRELGCDLAQGYHCGRPHQAEVIDDLLRG